MEAAFFDLDKTVIAKASVVAFGTPLYRHGLISRRTVLRGLWGQLVYLHLGADEAKIARMRESVLALTKGWDQARVQSIVEEALEAVVEPIIYGEALELMAMHRAEGRRIVIVSASPMEIVGPLARYLEVDEAIASEAMVDEEGRYTGKMAFDAFGPAKVGAMEELAAREGIDLAASYAYSDSATDIPMLAAVGHPVAVNADRELARAAADHGWETRVFVRPVRLRPRPRHAIPVAAAAAGGVALAAGAAWWWHVRSTNGDVRSRRGPGRDRPDAGPGQGLPGTASSLRNQRGCPPGRSGSPPGQSSLSFFAATAPRPMRMARRMSFFIPAG